MKTTLIGIAVLVVLGAIAYFVMPMLATAPATETAAETGTPLVPEETPTNVTGVTIHYTEAGFSPATVTVNRGTTVTFVNDGTGEMWIGSDEHPTHTQYDGTNKDSHCSNGQATGGAFDQCSVGASYSFTFTKTGTWGYHNHRDEDNKGTIIVQ